MNILLILIGKRMCAWKTEFKALCFLFSTVATSVFQDNTESFYQCDATELKNAMG